MTTLQQDIETVQTLINALYLIEALREKSILSSNEWWDKKEDLEKNN